MGLRPSRNPERAILMAAARVSMASSCPYTTIFKSRSRLRRTSLSDVETVLGGMRAIFDTTSSISPTLTTLRRLDGGRSFCRAPASSMTSMALSGRKRSLMYRSESSTAVRTAWREYLME